MSSAISRRSFLKISAAAATTATALPRVAQAREPKGYMTIIDLTLCDGCPGRDMPACVSACRDRNQASVPDPEYPMPKLFPRGKEEDWSKKKDVSDQLTPYNWLYLQKAEVDGQTINVPRRCMHCDTPACAAICPWSANRKNKDGAVIIDPETCFGGSKCRTVCPWSIPQRQSGVGAFLDYAPELAGNGVMFKCHLCHDSLAEGREPACVSACPTGATMIGPREEMIEKARARAEEIGGYLYGLEENGGTATIYISPVPFEKINESIDKGPGKPHLDSPIASKMAEGNSLAFLGMVAPVAGIAAGIAGAFISKKKESGDEE